MYRLDAIINDLKETIEKINSSDKAISQGLEINTMKETLAYMERYNNKRMSGLKGCVVIGCRCKDEDKRQIEAMEIAHIERADTEVLTSDDSNGCFCESDTEFPHEHLSYQRVSGKLPACLVFIIIFFGVSCIIHVLISIHLLVMYCETHATLSISALIAASIASFRGSLERYCNLVGNKDLFEEIASKSLEYCQEIMAKKSDAGLCIVVVIPYNNNYNFFFIFYYYIFILNTTRFTTLCYCWL